MEAYPVDSADYGSAFRLLRARSFDAGSDTPARDRSTAAFGDKRAPMAFSFGKLRTAHREN